MRKRQICWGSHSVCHREVRKAISPIARRSTLPPPPKRHLCSLAALHEKNKNLGLTIESKQKMAFLLTFGSQPNVMGIHPASCVCFIDLNLMSLYRLLFIEWNIHVSDGGLFEIHSQLRSIGKYSMLYFFSFPFPQLTRFPFFGNLLALTLFISSSAPSCPFPSFLFAHPSASSVALSRLSYFRFLSYLAAKLST